MNSAVSLPDLVRATRDLAAQLGDPPPPALSSRSLLALLAALHARADARTCAHSVCTRANCAALRARAVLEAAAALAVAAAA